MADDNMTMLQTVVKGLEELKDEVVFVGGVVAQMYATDPAATEIRPTNDVDCVIEIGSRLKYDQLGKRLRRKGFVDEIFDGVICRWIYRGIKADVMPTDEKILGFSNIWMLKESGIRLQKPYLMERKYLYFHQSIFLQQNLKL